jgi:chromosome segregation ATPase
METALRKFQQEVPLRERQVNDLDKELYKAQDAVADIDHQLGGVNSQIMSVQDQLSTIQRQSSNRLSAYGDGVNLVLDEIAKARWQRGKPVGPMGLFVQLEDRTYRAACESLLGSMMCTWVVQCDTDRETLRRILADCRRR